MGQSVVRRRGEKTGMAGFGRLALLAVCVSCVVGVENEGDDPLDWLRSSIPGEPGTDYPIMAATQESGFSCDGLVFGGYYADPATDCQQYSVCLQDPRVPLELQEDQEEERMQALAQLPHLALLMSALVQSPPAGVQDRGTQTALEMGSAALTVVLTPAMASLQSNLRLKQTQCRR